MTCDFRLSHNNTLATSLIMYIDIVGGIAFEVAEKTLQSANSATDSCNLQASMKGEERENKRPVPREGEEESPPTSLKARGQ
jgi:nitrate/TMAO reductase-like tetraheme cytochrome c subunit